MNSKFEKYEYLFPERVYRCPCFRLAIEECFFNEENSSIADIVYYLADFEFKNKLLMSRIFSTRVGENKEHCLFTCEAHLRTIILGMRKFVCIWLKMNKLFLLSTRIRKKCIALTV